MAVQIRQAVVADAEGIGIAHVAAWQAGYPGLIPDDYLAGLDPVARGARWRTTLDEGGSAATTLIAQVDGRIAGFASYGPPRDDVEDGWGEIWAVNLHPDFWRQGIGTALFGAATDALAGLGYQHGYLWVLQGNERAIGFYRRQSWPLDGRTKIDNEVGPPRFELRCSAALSTSGA